MLSDTVGRECVQPVAGRQPEVVERFGSVKNGEFG